MNNSGFIWLHRKLFDNPVVCKDADHLAVWIYLLCHAVWTPTDVMFHGERITLQAGQFTTGRKIIADTLKISESKVQRILKRFESEQQIEQRTDRQCRLITIVSWDEYQSCEQRIEQQVNNDRTTSEQRVNTKKEYKNIKTKERNIYIAEFDELWSIYPKKQGKENAKKSYLKARAEGVTREDVEKGIKAYADYIEATNTESRFIKHGSTFFNQRAWEDDWTVDKGYSRSAGKEESFEDMLSRL